MLLDHQRSRGAARGAGAPRAGGLVSNWICDNARAGDTLTVLPPAGRFTLRRPGGPALLFAGGSGIAPVISLARQALAAGGEAAVFYANRDRESAMLVAELEEMRALHGHRLELEYWYDADDGLPSAELLASFAADRRGRDAYVCGPEPFMRIAGEALARAGFDASHIHREDFGAPPDGDDETGGGEDAPASTLAVEFGGRTATVPVKGGESLLSAMLDAGLDVPHACNAGECASCMCRLVSGEVVRLGNSVLDDDDVADGWLVACRTRAAGGAVAIRFP
ncbi:3-ketosteroid-9-alpha-hydroxylase [Thauera sinica]|nr:3-ketosteroid-9-alpha-hydroxylase [Thauera sp. K11]